MDERENYHGKSIVVPRKERRGLDKHKEKSIVAERENYHGKSIVVSRKESRILNKHIENIVVGKKLPREEKHGTTERTSWT